MSAGLHTSKEREDEHKILSRRVLGRDVGMNMRHTDETGPLNTAFFHLAIT